MHLEKYISQFSLEEIIKIEESDLQFLSLQKSREKIKKNYGKDKKNKTCLTSQNLFLFLILQNSIVSYQIAGSGESWREEFSQKIFEDFGVLKEIFEKKISNIERRYDFLTSSKYNKRLYNLKTQRLKKLEKIKQEICLFEKNFSFLEYYNDMEKLFEILKKIFNSNPDLPGTGGKTISFAIKMFGYGSRIVFQKFCHFPVNIPIPVDSRLKKIYSLQKNQLDIKTYFKTISKKHKIPALHLDSLLRIDYRKLTKLDKSFGQKIN